MTRQITIDEERIGYAVWVNTDLTEGRGANIPTCICTHRATAVRFGEGRNVQGSDAEIRNEKIFQINGQWYGPVRIWHATDEDLAKEKESEALIEKSKARGKLVVKLKNLGISDEEISLLAD